MNLEATQRLLAAPWSVEAMPQIITEEHDSRWFEDFHMLIPASMLFEYRGHEIWGYVYAHDKNTKSFVALTKDKLPVYINEVHLISLSFSLEAQATKHALHGYTAWSQASVSFSKDADRSALKGLATKIFWDYLASGKNIAVTDSQQTASGAALWRKLIHSGGGYLTAVIDNSYTSDKLRIVSGDGRWEDGTHFQYSAKQHWKESDDGRLLRVFLKRDLV